MTDHKNLHASRLRRNFDALIVLLDAKGGDQDIPPECPVRVLCGLPILLVTVLERGGTTLSVASTPWPDVDWVRLPAEFGDEEVAEFLQMLRARAIRWPLGWIGGADRFGTLIRALPNAFWLYDARGGFQSGEAAVGAVRGTSHQLRTVLAFAHLLVVASQADLREIEQLAEYDGPSYTLRPSRARSELATGDTVDDGVDELLAEVLRIRESLAAKPARLNVAVLYDPVVSLHVATIREHLSSFQKHSINDIVLVPGSAAFWQRPAEETFDMLDFSAFDVVIVHYSLRLSVRDHLDEGIARRLETYRGLKVLFIQDEYEQTETARSWMDRLNFSLVYTCVPADQLELVYPAARFPTTDFLPTLTGYVPEDVDLGDFALPLRERRILIAYRGRRLHPVYGSLGAEKYRIGVEMKRHATQRGLNVDIEVDDEKRIYNDDWYRFLGSARATLGTESGSNVFDFTGSIKAEITLLRAQHPDLAEIDLQDRTARRYEGAFRMNQISPKIFESIRLRTALVLFEGAYSGVVQANRHYIPLAKDFSNIDEVLTKLQDDAFVEQLTERAYDEIIATGRYSYRAFVTAADRDITLRVLRSQGEKLLAPLMAFGRDGQLRTVLPPLPIGVRGGLHPMGRPPNCATRVAAQATAMEVGKSLPALVPRRRTVRVSRVNQRMRSAVKAVVFRTSRLLFRVRTRG